MSCLRLIIDTDTSQARQFSCLSSGSFYSYASEAEQAGLRSDFSHNCISREALTECHRNLNTSG